MPANETLARLRKAKQLRQLDLADLTGIPEIDISRFETGRRLPTPAQAATLAKSLGSALAKVFTKEQIKP